MSKVIAVIEDLARNACPEVRLFFRDSDFDTYIVDVMEAALNRASVHGEEWEVIRKELDEDRVRAAWEVFCHGLAGDSDAVEVRDTDNRYYVRNVEMPPVLSERELATVLASLRHAQKNPDVLTGPHFDYATPLADSEIDELCERLNA